MEMIRPPFKDWTVSFNRGVPTKNFALHWLKMFEQNVVVQPKYDGRWGLLHHEAHSDTITLWSRHGKIQLQETNPALTDFPEFKLHGEYIFGTSFAKESDLEGYLIVFDFEHPVLPLSDRIAKGVSLTLRLNQMGFSWIKMIEDEVMIDHSDTAVISSILSGERFGKVEGVVLKESTSCFGDPWVRIKPIYDVDYVVMGFNQSEAAKYKGRMIKSIKAGLYIDGKITHVCNVGGMSEKERSHMYQFPNAYLGNVITASGKDVFKSGALRHPNFVGMHPMKKAEECVLDKVLNH
jgi:hypothetical protein